MKTIKLTVSKDGANTEVDVDGVKGSSCEALTKDLLSALGGSIDQKLKAEFYAVEEDHVNLRS